MTEPAREADLNRINEAITFVGAAIVEEAQTIGPDKYRPGDSSYDGMRALSELLGCVRELATRPVPPTPAEITLLVSAAARLGDAVMRADAEVENIKQASDRRAAEIKDRHDKLRDADAFTVRITRADESVVNVGPYPFLHAATYAVAYFKSRVGFHPGAAGATYEIWPYDQTLPHRVGDVPVGVDALAALLGTLGTDAEPSGEFPDLYDRLVARHGALAHAAWVAAVDVFDAPHRTHA